MPSQRVRTVLCAAEPRGSAAEIEQLREVAREREVQAIAIVGDLGGGDGYRAVFRALGETALPTFWVPGPDDAPVAEYLREAHNMEVVHPLLHGVHGTAAFAPGYLLFAGLGGEISDDPDAPRDEVERLRYPRWEAEYRLKLVGELDEHERVLLFATPVAHKGRGTPGSEVLAELIGTHRPRLAVCGGERRTQMIGRSVVVAPGRLADRHYAIADLETRAVELEELGVASTR
jgi:Icc-related predicted phosphoesterase